MILLTNKQPISLFKLASEILILFKLEFAQVAFRLGLWRMDLQLKLRVNTEARSDMQPQRADGCIKNLQRSQLKHLDPDLLEDFCSVWLASARPSRPSQDLTLGDSHPDSGNWGSERVVGKTDFLSCKVSRIFHSIGNCLRDILCRYYVLISPFYF